MNTILLLMKYDVKCTFLGHAHITDFNIAATLHDKKLASSLSGTKPYIGMLILIVLFKMLIK